MTRRLVRNATWSSSSRSSLFLGVASHVTAQAVKKESSGDDDGDDDDHAADDDAAASAAIGNDAFSS